jgi:spoIIIJ-associated protein
MSSVEAEGRTIEEAVAEALKQLQVEREQAEIEVLSQATKGFLGIGGKKARVRVTLRVPLAAAARKIEPEAESIRQREGMRGSHISPAGPADEDETVLPTREMREKACAVLKEVIHLMNIEAALSCDIHEGEAVISITGGSVNLLIGHRGQTLDALEYLLNRMVTRSEEGESHFVLDAEGYRARRRKSLESLALHLGERVKRRRKIVTLSPLSPRDRRIIHLALQGDPLVTTKSMGRGYFRRLSILPEEGQWRERGKGTARMQTAE